jgi:hypothetical protein
VAVINTEQQLTVRFPKYVENAEAITNLIALGGLLRHRAQVPHIF